jgi:hypothetical protein
MNKLLILIALTVSTILSACGGGGSSGNGPQLGVATEIFTFDSTTSPDVTFTFATVNPTATVTRGERFTLTTSLGTPVSNFSVLGGSPACTATLNPANLPVSGFLSNAVGSCNSSIQLGRNGQTVTLAITAN